MRLLVILLVRLLVVIARLLIQLVELLMRLLLSNQVRLLVLFDR
jgi:hypothetical protein